MANELTVTPAAVGSLSVTGVDDDLYVLPRKNTLGVSSSYFASEVAMTVPTHFAPFVTYASASNYYDHSTPGWYTINAPNTAVLAPRARALPVYTPVDMDIDQVGLYVDAGSAGLIRLGSYAVQDTTSHTGFKPGALEKDFGTIDCTTSGVKTLAVAPDYTLTSGWHWFMFVTNASPTVKMLGTDTLAISAPISGTRSSAFAPASGVGMSYTASDHSTWVASGLAADLSAVTPWHPLNAGTLPAVVVRHA